jgi:hypothetical protein
MPTPLDAKRYREIRDAAGRMLVEHSDGLMPVMPREILRHLGNTRCLSFSDYKHQMRLPSDLSTKKLFGTQDALTSYDSDIDQYLTIYNNDDHAMKSPGRLRWTLAHELGHITLGHLRIEEDYERFEQEADYFAAMLLAYPAVIRACNVASVTVLQGLCGLSMPAAASRWIALQKSTMGLSSMDECVVKYFEQVIWEHNVPFVMEPDFSIYGR